MNIQPQYLNLNKLLENRLFRIPHYQRAYSWKTKQRSDMFSDIKKLKGNPDNSHFMATVVGLCRETRRIHENEYQFIEIVDGQQRLTTLVLLLKTIQQKLTSSLIDADRQEGTPEARSERSLQELLVKQDDLSLVLLQTNHDLSQYFANFLRDSEGVPPPPISEAQTLADKELLRAIHECKSFVDQWEDTIELLSIIKNQLRFIFHEITDEAAVYTVFEVLNNRGLYVSWLDRLKSMLMAVVFEDNQGNSVEHIKELHQIWGAIYETVGLQEALDTESLRFAATLRLHKYGRKLLSEEVSFNRIKSDVGGSAAKTIEISKWLLEVTKAVKQVHVDMQPYKAVVTKIVHTRLLAVSILLRKFEEEEETRLLTEWERISFLIFGLRRNDARTGVGDYVNLACDIWNKDDFQVDAIFTRINKLGNPYKFNPYDELWNMDCYTDWQAELRYLLCRYEEYLASLQGQRFSNEQWNRIWQQSPASSIEHILPQSKGVQYHWQKGTFVHKLGNLMLLPPGLNSVLGSRDPVEKAAEYRKIGFFDAANVAQTIEANGGWGDEQIEEREKDILGWIAGVWEWEFD